MYPAAADGAETVVTPLKRAAPGPDKLSVLYPALLEADDRGDVQVLARLGWALFEIASSAEQAHLEATTLLHELCVAARVATAGRGGLASLAMLRAVLARHGWLPPDGATPLQVLAGPNPLTPFYPVTRLRPALR